MEHVNHIHSWLRGLQVFIHICKQAIIVTSLYPKQLSSKMPFSYYFTVRSPVCAAPQLCPKIISVHKQTVNLPCWRWLFHCFGFPVCPVPSATSLHCLTHCHHGEFNPCKCVGLEEKLCSGILISISPTGTDFPRTGDPFVSSIRCPSIQPHCAVITDFLDPVTPTHCQEREVPWPSKSTSSQIETMKSFDRILSISFRK